MGAEEYGMGTSSLVAMGCIMVRQCPRILAQLVFAAKIKN